MSGLKQLENEVAVTTVIESDNKNIIKELPIVNDKITSDNLTDIKIKVNKYYDIQKRIFDLILAISGLILLSPLFLIVMLIIKMEDSNSKIFFVQERIGHNERKFKMYKFRSMVSNAESQLAELLEQNEVSGAMFKLKNDPRITPIGKFIRKTSIDELPQLINVIKGDMSLVGPRPPLEREVIHYSKRDLQRLSVIPGCTGLWQATVRNSVGFEEMVNLDLEYINKRSLYFDTLIILITIKSLLIKKAH